MGPKQIDCFKLNMVYWKYLAAWPDDDNSRCYKYYTKIFITFFVLLYNFVFTVNFYFLPRELDRFIEEMLFYFTELAILSKVLTLLIMRDKIKDILNFLERDVFQPDSDALIIIKKAKQFTRTYWKIIATVSYTSNLTHVLSPVVMHILFSNKLELPICNYSFLNENTKQILIYPLYFYQSIGMHFHMLFNVNVDTFFIGLMILTIAQLEILDDKLRRVTNYDNIAKFSKILNTSERELFLKFKLSKCIVHFGEINKFCRLVNKVFSLTLFVQVVMSSCIICVSLFRFTLPATSSYYVFLTTYCTVMVVQILVPCWFGSRIMETSSALSLAVYSCDWTPRTPAFKSNLRLFVERMKKPLSITGWKMFSLSLGTFTSIMNTAYSFFTLLRHMQSRES